MDEAVALRMTLTDVAALARVQRPVVSMWRKRSAGSVDPFPAPIGVERGLEVFDAHEVARWLSTTGRGNNPDAAADLASFSRLPHVQGEPADQRMRPNFDGLTSLLTLKALLGSPLGALDRDDLLDGADEHDPDDLFLYSELDALGSTVTSLARFADHLADSAYNEAEAFEGLLANRFRTDLREHADTALSDAAVALVASAAVDLAVELDADPVFIDSTSGGSDVLLAVVETYGDRGPFTVLTADDGGAAARLVRRRLRVHGVENATVRGNIDGSLGAPGPAVHVAQYPSPGNTGMDAAGILAAVEQTALQLDDSQRAVIIAPARVLCDSLGGKDASELRSGLLRSGRVRAIARLPQGLLRAKPRETQALWVLGPSYADVGIADRWTMVADLSQQRLTDDVAQDLISDVVASMGNLPTVRAHSFRFARLVRTRSLLAARGALVTPPAVSEYHPPRRPADDAVRVEHLLRHLGAGNGSPLAVSVTPSDQGQVPGTARIAQLMAAGHLRYIQGNRLGDTAAKITTDDGGPRLIGPPDLVQSEAPIRRTTLLDFAAVSPSGRLTQAGDIVFCTSPRPAALVDASGGSVVVFPARVLRIDDGDPGGLLADVVAADINALPDADKTWRHWVLRRIPDDQRGPLRAALAALQHERDTVRQRLADVEELASLILDGVTGGSLTLTEPIPPVASTEGNA